jgi:ribosomal protein S18 acetylase RimI-like enzyme
MEFRRIGGTMRIRVLGPDDAAAFQRVRLQALLVDPVAFASSYEEERDTPIAIVAERLRPLPDRAIVGAFDGGRLIGVAAWHREEMRKLRHKGFVWGVFVSETHRRRGVARALMRAVIAHARGADGIRQVNLVAHDGNHAAIALYESLGFAIYGREPAAICVDGLLHDDVHMSLRL